MQSPRSPVQHSVPDQAPVKAGGLYPTPQWRDLWAAILYYAHLAVFLAIAGWALWSGSHHLDVFKKMFHGDASVYGFLAVQILGILITAGGLTTASIILLDRQTELMIKASLFALPSWFFLMAILFFALLPHPAGMTCGIIYIVIGGITTLLYFFWRKYIPLTTMIARMTLACVHNYTSLYTATGLFALAQSVVFVFYFTVAVALVGLSKSQEYGNACAIMLLYLVFSVFWTSQVFVNVLQTTIAGVFATHYFSPGGEKVQHALSESFRRAATYSFGSICFGSLIVALIQMMRFMLQSMIQRNSIAGAIADCLLGIIEGLVEYFNYYAYTHIAIYGKSYIEAAKDTWHLIKANGVEAIVNDNFMGAVAWLTSATIGLVCMCVTTLIGYSVYQMDWAPALVLGFWALIIGACLSALVFQIITAGATATFVCIATSPTVLKQSNPEMYNFFIERYPSFASNV